MEQWLQDVVANIDQARMIAPVLLAAIISGGSTLLGSYMNSRQGAGAKDPARIPDPMRDPLTAALGKYYENKVGQSRPAYEGQLSAEPNEVLLQAIQQAMGQSQGYNNPINDLITKFMSPAGSQGWNPVSAGWNRRPGGQSGSTGGVSSEVASLVNTNLGIGG